MKERIPIVFISYSHDNPDHKQWVSELASKLRQNGIEVIFDLWDLEYGDDLSRFMSKGIADSDRVLVICTDEYVQKAEAGEGGVGYEGTIVNVELLRNVNTNKFIPIIKQASGEKKTPDFLGTRTYVNAQSGVIADEDFDKLLRDLHKMPPQKPQLGKNPFFKTLSGEEVFLPVKSTPLTLSNFYSDPLQAYNDAKSLIRNEDMFGWRELVKKIRSPMRVQLLEWREKYDNIRPKNQKEFEAAIDDAFDKISPLTAIALAGVESGHPKFRNQKLFFDDIYTIPGWNMAGLVTLIKLPKTLSYIFQALHGSMCINTGQIDLILNLANTKIRIPEINEYVSLWKDRSIMGWPHTLGDNCVTAWKYLSSLATRFEWLDSLFEDEFQYKVALTAYYMTLNIYEFANYIASGKESQIKDTEYSLNFNIPLCFTSESSDVLEKAISLLVNSPEELKKLWNIRNVNYYNQMITLWSDWQQQGCKWIERAYPFSHSRWYLNKKLPHAAVFEN